MESITNADGPSCGRVCPRHALNSDVHAAVAGLLMHAHICCRVCHAVKISRSTTAPNPNTVTINSSQSHTMVWMMMRIETLLLFKETDEMTQRIRS